MKTATRRPKPFNGTSPAATVRVGIYTRKSTEDGLEQEFNSLDAQRAAVEAYVQSQRGEGWVAVPEHYDDGGYTGANTDRPAFQRLLADIEAGKVDVVGCYKIDRLSRSLLDFMKTMETFQRRGVTFVSVTQQFNTTTSVGRFTLNLLASFAEFERETISERTRDKMGASRRRGLWTGGVPVLGYAATDKKLVVLPDEAALVREVFRLYGDLGSTLGVAEELSRRGHVTKSGKRWDKQAVRAALGNPLYAGRMRAGEELVRGQHEAIVDVETFDAAQRLIAQHGKGCRPRSPGKSGALLLGLLRCGRCGSAMTAHTARKGNRQHLAYVCVKYQKEGAAACPGSRVSVGDIERFVVEQVRAIGKDPRLVRETIESAKRLVVTRGPELERDLRELEKDTKRPEGEKRNLVDAVAQGGDGVAALLLRLGEVEVESQRLGDQAASLRAERDALRAGTIDEDDLRAALERFEPLWDALVPAEKSRVLHLLLERVVYDAEKGEVAMTFRPGGVRVLAAEEHP